MPSAPHQVFVNSAGKQYDHDVQHEVRPVPARSPRAEERAVDHEKQRCENARPALADEVAHRTCKLRDDRVRWTSGGEEQSEVGQRQVGSVPRTVYHCREHQQRKYLPMPANPAWQACDGLSQECEARRTVRPAFATAWTQPCTRAPRAIRDAGPDTPRIWFSLMRPTATSVCRESRPSRTDEVMLP